MTVPTRVVVVGNGMAGARLVEELLRRDPACDVTVVGAEDRPAYNRVLLSDVLAGKRGAGEIGLTSPTAVRRLGVRVTGVDRTARTVTLDGGDVLPYDALVLATGSTAVVPPVHGIAGPSGQLLPGVFVFRTLDDCADIAAAAGRARKAVVVGGGLLGLEAARGLLQHGLQVDVVHGAGHLMDVQLDAVGGAVLRRAVEALGVGVHLGSFASSVTGNRRVTGVGLADGRHVDGDLVVLACGVRPEVGLARAAGLNVERGVLVDDQLTTSDPDVFALGECSQHRGQVYGLVAPAWEQATVLAEVLTGGDASYTGSRTVARLKAMDLDVAAMGDVTPGLEDCGAGVEVLSFADPVRHVYKKLVVTDGVVTGAVLLGDLSTAGPVTQAFDRGTVLPAERLHLLFAGLSSGPPAEVRDDDVVCTCNGVTAGTLRRCGARTVPEAAAETRATTGCGTCTSSVAALLGTAPSPQLVRSTA
ncbi:MAG: nitrite reductase large subunit [Frankiales bacterium]|nr:nitrite reductase large subunit [Frankiales bacterium]